MQMNTKYSLTGLLVLFLVTGSVHAEKRYVTDRILLGIHKEATESSQLIKSVASGTEMEVLGTTGDFARIKLRDGTEGWVSQAYLTDKQPAVVQLNQSNLENEKLKEEIENMKREIFKKEKEVQLHRDELSNARTTIRELKKQNKTGQNTAEDRETEQKLQKAEQEAEKLQQHIQELETKLQQQASAPTTGETQQAAVNQDTHKQLDELRSRIDMASAYLAGTKIPSTEELNAAYPRLPSWFWGVLVLVLIAGVLGGILLMDYRLRKRHGGFRV